MSLPSLDLLRYPDGSASLILAAESEKRAPSLFNSELAHSLLAKALDKQAIINEFKNEYMFEDLNSLLSDVSLCGHFLGSEFRGVLPLATPPELSLPVHFIEPSLPRPSWLNPLSSSSTDASESPKQRYIPVHDQAIEDPAALRARMAARDGGGSLMAGADWRGFSITVPLQKTKDSDKGEHDVMDPSQWLADLDCITSSSSIHGLTKGQRVKAPGLPCGLFGGWMEPNPQAIGGTDDGGKGASKTQMQLQKSAQASSIVDIFDKENFWLLDVQDELSVETQVDEVKSEAAIKIHPVADEEFDLMDGRSEDVDALLMGSEDLGSILTDKAQKHQEKMAARASKSVSSAPLAGQVLPPSFRGSASQGQGQGGSHEWAVRAAIPDLDEQWSRLKPQLAIQYPFELDTFQKEAIVSLEAGKSVFVAAHTSAGKTVVAEYAFALATRHCTKAIYTSPIKTISNQKYRDFSGKFQVGLLTGDVQLNTSSPCLIMTTEILRSMLYKGADIIRDIEWVIFDEVHYVNDAERGVVWEEVIIMLPAHVNIIMLSATVPNVMDFADWVGRTKRKVIQVTGTTRRPVPLEHSLYYGGEMFLISSKEALVPEGLRQASLAFKRKNDTAETKKDEKAARPTGRGGGPIPGPNNAGGRGGGGGGRGGSADAARKQIQRSGYGGYGGGGGSSNSKPGERGQLSELITLLSKKALLPVAFFTFSKKRCDASVDGLGGLDLTTSQEKHTIHSFMAQCLSRLREEDRSLPQIMRLRDLMKRGLAVHHAGLLPIAKEMVEMLFCQGYIKVLFCTETFAMGVNAPTRTVVFHSIRKHDGKNHRYLLPSEYTQMAGRAGRRGLDAVGTVLIACWDELPPESEVKTMLTGRGVSLESQFRLTYSMILNLLRTEDMKVEDMLKRSFAEWRAQRSMPKGQQQLEDIERRLARARTIPWPQCIAGCCKEEVEDYLQCTLKIEDLNSKIQAKIMLNRSVQQSLVTGRVVLYSNRVNGLTEIAVVLGDTPSSNSSWAASEGAVAAAPKVTLFGNTSSSTLSGSQASSSSKDPPDRKLYLLTLHKPGPADKKHSKQQEALAPPPPPPQALKKQDDSDPFAGMVMKGQLDTNRGTKAAAALGSKLAPNDLPRYSKLGGYDYLIIEAGSRDIIGIGKTKVKIEAPQDILDGDWEGGTCRKALTSALLALSRVQEEEGGPAAPYLMDFRTDLKVADIDVVGWLSERDQWMARRAALRPHSCTELSEQFGLVRTLHALNAAKETLTHQLSDASLSQLPEFHQRVSLLQSLGYLDPESTTITLKGRALCEINSTQDELLATEMIFSGLLSDLSPAESVSLLSCLVFQEKSDVEPELPPSLVAARKDLEELALRAGENQRSHGLQIDPQEYARDALKCGLMQVTYEWACGKPFAEIITCTDVMEGSIVRCIVRLDQACRELMDASRVLGNTELFQKMQAASQAIKRDIVFAASLYVA